MAEDQPKPEFVVALVLHDHYVSRSRTCNKTASCFQDIICFGYLRLWVRFCKFILTHCWNQFRVLHFITGENSIFFYYPQNFEQSFLILIYELILHFLKSLSFIPITVSLAPITLVTLLQQTSQFSLSFFGMACVCQAQSIAS